MARTLALPGVRIAPQRVLLGWSGATLLGSLLLPWARAGRDLTAFLGGSTGLELVGRAPLLAMATTCAALGLVLAFMPFPPLVRGRATAVVGAFGALASAAYIALEGHPVGPGALAAVLGFLGLCGSGLALSAALDPFLGAGVLWVWAFVAVFILLPLLSVVAASVWVQGHFTLEVIVRTLRSPGFFLLDRRGTPYHEPLVAVGFGLCVAVATTAYLLRRGGRWRAVGTGLLAGTGAAAVAALGLGFGALRNSLLLAVAVGSLCTVLGFLFALLDARSRLPTRVLLGPFSILPVITPPFVLGLAMIFLFGRRGLITHRLLGLSTDLFFGPIGVGFAQVLAYTPIAYLVLQGVVRSLDATLEEAAETLGASRWHILRTVIWPLSRPGLANAFLLVAIESLADFANPILVGGGATYLATEVFFAIVGRYNPHEAAVYGVVLLTITLGVFVVQRLWLGERSYVTVTGRPTASAARPLPAALDLAVSALFGVWMALVVVIYGTVFVGALTRLWGFDSTFTLQHLRDLSPQGWHVFWTSVRLSAYAAVPSMLLGFLIGYLVSRVSFPTRSALEFSAMLSFAVPGTVMGIGYILAFNQGPLLLTGTELILVLAFVFRNMPVAIRAAVAALQQVDRSLEEASTLLRAGAAMTLRRVVVPLVWPALLSGLVFAFVRAMTAVSQVIFLITPRHNLATTQILSYVEYGSLGRGAALASLLTVFLVAVILALYTAGRRLDARAAGPLPAA